MTTTPREPEDVVGEFRGEIAVLRSNGHRAQADSMERVLDAVAEAFAPYLERLTEERAHARSGKSADWLRARHADWMTQGLAGKDVRGRRWYRRCVVPIRANLEAARAQAERDAQSAA